MLQTTVLRFERANRAPVFMQERRLQPFQVLVDSLLREVPEADDTLLLDRAIRPNDYQHLAFYFAGVTNCRPCARTAALLVKTLRRCNH